MPGETGNFGLGVQNEAGQRITVFSEDNTLVIANIFFQKHKMFLGLSPNVTNNATMYVFMVISSFLFLECLQQSGTVHPETSKTYKAPVLTVGRNTQQINVTGRVG